MKKTGKNGFLIKIHICPKMGKMGPKWPKNKVFWLFWKNLSLVFAGFSLEWKFIWLFVSLVKSHMWENSGSEAMDQNGPKMAQKWSNIEFFLYFSKFHYIFLLDLIWNEIL